LLSNTATDIVGFVSDDPYERFESQSNNAGTVAAADDVGLCADIVYAAGATPDYISRSRVRYSGTMADTTAQQLKIIGLSKDIRK
jgi:hypothetical protein